MPKLNPYLDEIRSRGVLDDLNAETLATLAVAHELREANLLTEAINTPTRFVVNSQNPISPEEIQAEMSKTKIMAVSDDSGDARIAEAARAATRRHETRSAHPREILAELLRAVDEEDQR